MVIQIVVTLVAVICAIAITKRLRKGAIGLLEALGWGILWVGAVTVVWNPLISNKLAAWLGVGRGADAVLYSALVILFYAVLRLFARIENLEHSISMVVKKTALESARKEIDSAVNTLTPKQQ